ncbi:MAG: L-2-amino-thiazoline-4-carboxylic acid hydrolase [Coriobacteriales bacterium]|nr:L-2-amino-thiazoline-4-carboxylic acid hydrolase [Coriobacteriales bacterium]
MHEYYASNKDKLKRGMDGYLSLIATELEDICGKPYAEVFEEMWDFYERELLEHFPYIGGDSVSGTANLTGAYYFVAMGEVLKRYGADMPTIGYRMVQSYRRHSAKIPGPARSLARRAVNSPRLAHSLFTSAFQKKDRKNAANAAQNPGSFETQTMVPPEEGFDFSYHNLVCPLANFARAHGYEEYMPYLCNLDYVLFGMLGVPLFREHTCFEDGDYCDFKVKCGAEPLSPWPPVFMQDNRYK